MLRIVLYCSFISLLLVACSPSNKIPSGSDDSDANEESTYIEPSSEYSITIKELRGLYRGETTRITDDVVIDGIVMANDAFGELYKSFIIEDGTAAVKIMCDMTTISGTLSIGSQVSVKCSSLWLGASGASLLIGCEPTGDYVVDYIPADDLWIYVKTLSPEIIYPSVPTLAFSELTDDMALRSLLFEDVVFKSSLSQPYYVMPDFITGELVTTYHTLYDKKGNEIELVVSPHVTYASALVPTAEVTLCAIVERYGSDYSLMVVNGLVGGD